MTDFGEPAGSDAFELPPYDPYAGWDAPAPYITDTAPARPTGEAEAIAAGLLPDPAKAPAPIAMPAADGAVPVPLPAAAFPATQPPQVQPVSPLTLMPALPELPPSDLTQPGQMYELASFSQRARALSIDSFILLIPTVLVLAVVMPGVFRASGGAKSITDAAAASGGSPSALLNGGTSGLSHSIVMLGIAASVVYWGILAVYTGVFMTRSGGQTPGRRAAGIRVMREDGAPITFGWAVYRTVLVREVAFSVVSLFTFGLATLAQYGWSLWDHERRSLHDMIARSRVVVDRGARSM